MITDLAVVGYPSMVGGADTELYHQITCWQALGIRVHLCHTYPLDQNLLSMGMDKRGCIVHKPRDWASLQGMPCISYCNGEFLSEIQEIKKYVTHTIWVNCMTWLFDKEKEAHKNGLIDWFVYQTKHAYEKVAPELRQINPRYNALVVRPYFDISDFPFTQKANDRFRFCRISRDDADKFNKFQWWIYETMTAPVFKEGIVLGSSDKIKEKLGTPPNWVTQLPAGSMKVQDVYAKCHCLIMTTDTYENLPRVGFEAMASGCVPIVDNRGGWQELVLHKQTGFLCNNEREFVYYASRAAFERQERESMAAAARYFVANNYGLESSKQQWKVFLDLL